MCPKMKRQAKLCVHAGGEEVRRPQQVSQVSDRERLWARPEAHRAAAHLLVSSGELPGHAGDGRPVYSYS